MSTQMGVIVHKIMAKTRAAARVPVALSADTVALLQRHRRAQTEQRAALGPAYSGEGLVFAGPTGKPLDDRNLRRAFDRMVAKAGLPRLRLHDLRHTAATLMLRVGIHPKVVSERLGHATVGLTLNKYSHVLPDLQRDAAEVMDGVLRRGIRRSATGDT